jgi:hypothetical protein
MKSRVGCRRLSPLRVRGVIAAIAATMAAACSSESFTESRLDVTGSYVVTLVPRDNGCDLSGVEIGKPSTGIEIGFIQNGQAVTGDVSGIAGALLTGLIGTAQFTGTLQGDQLDVVAYGTRSFTEAECAYNLIATVKARVDGNALTGTLTYTTKTNGSPGCGALETCASTSEFVATRATADAAAP